MSPTWTDPIQMLSIYGRPCDYACYRQSTLTKWSLCSTINLLNVNTLQQKIGGGGGVLLIHGWGVATLIEQFVTTRNYTCLRWNTSANYVNYAPLILRHTWSQRPIFFSFPTAHKIIRPSGNYCDCSLVTFTIKSCPNSGPTVYSSLGQTINVCFSM